MGVAGGCRVGVGGIQDPHRHRVAGEPDIYPPFLCTLFDGLLAQLVRPAANTEGGVCKWAWRVRSLRSLYIYVCPSSPYQEISPPVAFSSPRAGVWCAGRGRWGAGAAVGEAAAHQRLRRGSRWSAVTVKLDWGEVHPANEAIYCPIAGPHPPLEPTDAPHPLSFPLLRFWPQT
eukprot:scaffold54966_cov60-Phaeocystis_antarctica.AAC.4